MKNLSKHENWSKNQKMSKIMKIGLKTQK